MIDEPEINPEQARLEDLVAMAQKRVRRADERREAANREVSDAFAALDQAASRLAAWKAENPDPQLTFIEAVTLNGERE